MSHDGGPEPDERSVLGVVFDAEGPRSMAYADLRDHARTWPVAEAAAPGPRALLATARETFALAIYHYQLFVIAATWSLMAVEACLRQHYQAGHRPLAKLIDQALADDLLDDAWAQRLHDGRKLRNTLIHAHEPVLWSPSHGRSSHRHQPPRRPARLGLDMRVVLSGGENFTASRSEPVAWGALIVVDLAQCSETLLPAPCQESATAGR